MFVTICSTITERILMKFNSNIAYSCEYIGYYLHARGIRSHFLL